MQLDEEPLVSQYLAKLKLSFVEFNEKLVDFSGCPALEELEIEQCDFARVFGISSNSLKHLTAKCSSFSKDYRNCIHVPNLISLQLHIDFDRVPLLREMPLLVDAAIRTFDVMHDICSHSLSGDCDNEHCNKSYGADGQTDSCVLLNGLSAAKKLVLVSDMETVRALLPCLYHFFLVYREYIFTIFLHAQFILRRDLKWCPTFRNLKTLLLNEYWCVPADFTALSCILEHAPVLEKLMLHLFCMV